LPGKILNLWRYLGILEIFIMIGLMLIRETNLIARICFCKRKIYPRNYKDFIWKSGLLLRKLIKDQIVNRITPWKKWTK
jgi:hypothetical protein